MAAADFADEESVREDENDYDVIIIGAGLAGLTCAYNILRKETGLDVLVIEANSKYFSKSENIKSIFEMLKIHLDPCSIFDMRYLRLFSTGEIGGRILQKSFSNTYHANSLQKHVTDLVKRLHIKIDQASRNETNKKVLCTNDTWFEILPKFYGAEVHDFFRTIEESVLNSKFSNYTGNEEEAKYLAETSVEQLLCKIVYFPYARSLCRAYICSTCAVRDLNNVSALWFFVMLNGASGFLNRLKIMIGDSNRYFVQDGMCKITHILLKNILRQHGKIRYVEPVSKITFNDDRAYVSTTRNYFRCKFVVIAIPPSMQNSIIIEPPLSSINIETLYTPAENMFFNVFYKKPFWRSNSAKDIITTWDSSNNLNIVYDATLGNTEGTVFAGFLAEPNLEQTHKKGLFDTLEDCYETVEASRFLRYKEYDQPLINDEMKPGCPMSVLKPISIQDYINHTEASYERIFFASSEYAINWPGTIDGAIQAGEIAAYEILWRIRPQALSSREMSRVGSTKIKIKARSDQPYSLKVCVLQYLGILLHVAVLVSFLRIAYD